MLKYFYLLFVLSLLACSREEIDMVDDNESITTVKLTFTNDDNLEKVFYWRDGKVDPILLEAEEDYDLAISFLNESKMPVQDLTVEVEEESNAHLVVVKALPASLFLTKFFDKDDKGRKLGLKNRIKTNGKGQQGFLHIKLLHQPPINGVEMKDGVNESIGSTDVDVEFKFSLK